MKTMRLWTVALLAPLVGIGLLFVTHVQADPEAPQRPTLGFIEVVPQETSAAPAKAANLARPAVLLSHGETQENGAPLAPVIPKIGLAADIGVAVSATPRPIVDQVAGMPKASNGCAGGICSESYFTAEAIFFHLSRARTQDLVLNQNSGNVLLSTSDLNYNFEPGVRFTCAYALGEQATLEAVYFGLNHWYTSGFVKGNNDLKIPDTLGLATDDFFGADSMSVSCSSRIHNAELNYYHRHGCSSLELLAGFRYFNLVETFNIQAMESDAQQSDYNVRANNNLFGGQIGGRWRRQIGVIGLDFSGKAGVFGNQASQRTFMGDFNNTFIFRDFQTRRCQAAFIGELGLNASCRLTQHVFVKAGYNILWLEGIARAADQLDFTDTPTSGTALHAGSAFLHGANVGVELRW